MSVEDKIFNLVEGGEKLDLFERAKEFGEGFTDMAVEASQEVSEEILQAEAGKALQATAIEGLTPLPGEFIPSEAGLGVDDKAFNEMQKQIKDEVKWWNMDRGGPYKEDIMKEHGQYKKMGRDEIYTSERDLEEGNLERRQSSLEAQGVGKTDMELYKEQFKKNYAEEGYDVDTWELTEEDYESLRDWEIRNNALMQKDTKLYDEHGGQNRSFSYGSPGWIEAKKNQKEFADLRAEFGKSEWGQKMLKGTGQWESWSQNISKYGWSK